MENELHTLASAINCRDWNSGADTTPYCNLYGLHLALYYTEFSAHLCSLHSAFSLILNSSTFVQPAFGIQSWLLIKNWNDKKILKLFLKMPLVLYIGPEPVQSGVTTTDLNWCTHSSYRPSLYTFLLSLPYIAICYLLEYLLTLLLLIKYLVAGFKFVPWYFRLILVCIPVVAEKIMGRLHSLLLYFTAKQEKLV